MSGCPIFDRVTMINSNPEFGRTNSNSSFETSTGTSGITNCSSGPSASSSSSNNMNGCSSNISDPLDSGGGGGGSGGSGATSSSSQPNGLERDYYGCYCLKFIVKNGTHITEEKVMEDFGTFGDVVDIRGPGLFSGLRGNHVYVRFIERSDAEEALKNLGSKYHQLTPASISDVLPDNYGLYTISFYNKTGIPSSEVRREFSKFGEVKNLTGSLDVKGGRVFVSYKEKNSAVQALQAFFFRKDRYPNMKFALPRCEKDYFGCYCLKFYNKSGDVTEEKVLKDFGQFGDVVDVRGPGLFDVTGDDVYVRYKDKSSAEQALIELVGKYDSLCLAPPSDIQADKFGYFTITFVNDKCLSKSDVWYIFSKFGTVACVNGTFDCKKGRVFVSYKEKQGALNALETMLTTKEYHLQVSKNSTVRKNDYNIVTSRGDLENSDSNEITIHPKSASTTNNTSNTTNHTSSSNNSVPGGGGGASTQQQQSLQQQDSSKSSRHTTPPREHSRTRSADLKQQQVVVPPQTAAQVVAGGGAMAPIIQQQQQSSSAAAAAAAANNSLTNVMNNSNVNQLNCLENKINLAAAAAVKNNGGGGGLVKFNRNVEKDIFGYYCLSFLNEDGDINEKKVRHDFGKFGEVVSVRGALGKQKGHVFVRFRRKESAENCLNCLNSFPLSEMSELFGKYLFLSPATPRDIDCDMHGLYSISFLNLYTKDERQIHKEFSKFGEVVRVSTGGGGNTDELISISYADKNAAIKALQTHFTTKEFPYLDIAKGSSLLLVNSSDSSDNENDNESDYIHYPHPEKRRDPFHDPSPTKNGQGDVVDELLKPFQSYFSIYRTGQYSNPMGGFPTSAEAMAAEVAAAAAAAAAAQQHGLQHPGVPPGVNTSPQQPTPGGVVMSSPGVASNNNPSSSSTIVPPQAPVMNASSSSSASSSNPPPPPPSLLPPQHPAQQQRSPDKKYRVKKNSKNGFTSGPIMTNGHHHHHHHHHPQQHQQHHGSGKMDSPQESEDNIPRNPPPLSSSSASEPSMVSPTNGWTTTTTTTNNDLTITPDIFGLYSVSFSSKELNEKKIRSDFSNNQGLLLRIKCSMNDSVILSFDRKEAAEYVLHNPILTSKYPSLRPASNLQIAPDRDGFYSIEFINSGMNGIREITNEFSKHGEVMKVQQGGAKNAVKKVTVSYSDKNSAFSAVQTHRESKDFLSLDFARDCVIEDATTLNNSTTTTSS